VSLMWRAEFGCPYLTGLTLPTAAPNARLVCVGCKLHGVGVRPARAGFEAVHGMAAVQVEAGKCWLRGCAVTDNQGRKVQAGTMEPVSKPPGNYLGTQVCQPSSNILTYFDII
jgi:hypothetical protein